MARCILSYCLGFTALSGIYLLFFYYAKVLRWKYGWTTLSHETIQKKCPKNILNILKNITFIFMSGLFLSSFRFVIGPLSYRKNYCKNLDAYILVKRPLERLHLHPQWGPDTHKSPQQRGAASKVEQPLLCRKKCFKN